MSILDSLVKTEKEDTIDIVESKARIVVSGSYYSQVEPWLYYYKKSGTTTPVLLMYDRGWEEKELNKFRAIGEVVDFSWFFDKRREKNKAMNNRHLYWTVKPAIDYYADCDVMLWLDFDVQIRKDLTPLIKSFIDSNKSYGIADYFNGYSFRYTRPVIGSRLANSGMHFCRPKSEFAKNWFEFAEKNYTTISFRDELLLYHYLKDNPALDEVYRFDGPLCCFDCDVILPKEDDRNKIKPMQYRIENMTDCFSWHWCGYHAYYVQRFLEQRQKDIIENAMIFSKKENDEFLNSCGLVSSNCKIVNGILNRDFLPVVLCRMKKTGIGVEVGVQRGDFSERLLKETMLSKIISVDFWGTKEQNKGYYDLSMAKTEKDGDLMFSFVTERLKPYNKRSEVWRRKSIEASTFVEDSTLDFVYLDSALDYENVSEDLKAWFPKLKTSGVMAGHDFTEGYKWGANVQVMSSVQEFAILNDLTVYVALSSDDSPATWFLVKK